MTELATNLDHYARRLGKAAGEKWMRGEGATPCPWQADQESPTRIALCRAWTEAHRAVTGADD